MTKFSKFVRPEKPSRGVISDRDLDIIAAILRYRYSPASELVRLVGGNEDVTHRRLRWLWECGLINRWAFPDLRRQSGEFHYYLDNRASVELLVTHRKIEPHRSILEEIDNNREKNYADAAFSGRYMQLGFLKHQLQVSRMHFMLEMAARESSGKVELSAWHQGAQLKAKVWAPKVRSRRVGPSNEYLWQESDDKERLPVEPDALFTLHFKTEDAGRDVHFCYEADRGTMTQADMLRKFRAYYHFIKKQQGHKQAFGIHPVRAVLIETTDEQRGWKLMELAAQPIVSGVGKRAGLFWFTVSNPMFTAPYKETGAACYLHEPTIVLKRIWALADQTLLALGDPENSQSVTVGSR